MFISCFPNTYGRFGPQAAIQLLPEVGIHWLELPIKNQGQPSFFKEEPLLTEAATAADLAHVSDLLQAAGMRVSSCNISSGNPLDPAAVARLLKKLPMVQHFGATRVVAGGGELTDPADWPQLVRHLRQIGDVADGMGITYCCETHPGTCRNAASMLELMERVDHPRIRINFDTGNIFYYNQSPDLLSEFQQIASFIEHVHLKDTPGGYEEWNFSQLGAGGAVDFVAIREALEQIDFNGPCSLELEGIAGEPELTLEETQSRVRASIDHLKACGWQI